MSTTEALIQAARWGLPGTDDATTVAIAPADSRRLVMMAGYDHLTGLLVGAITDGLIDVDAEGWDAAQEQWHQELTGCVVLEALALRVAALWDGEVRWRLTKGPALAHLDYPNAELRTFGDIDVIVHPDDWTVALQLLEAAGYTRAAASLGDRYDADFGKGATISSPEGLELDAHRRLAIGRFGVTSKMEDLFDSDACVALGGLELPTLDPSERLLHACYHAALGGFQRLRAFRDVAQLVLVTEADWEKTFGIAERWRGPAVVAAAIEDTWSRLELTATHPAVAAAREVPRSRLDRQALRIFQQERPFRQQALTAVPRLRIMEVPVYLWTLVAPRRRRRSTAAGGSAR